MKPLAANEGILKAIDTINRTTANSILEKLCFRAIISLPQIQSWKDLLLGLAKEAFNFWPMLKCGDYVIPGSTI